MPKINFYIIKQTQQAELLFFVCRLTEKIYSQGHKIYIHTESSEMAETLDDLLWSFRPESFLPHEIMNSNDEDTPPIIIGFGNEHIGEKDVLINLATEVPVFHGDFQRIAEIVRNEESCKQLGREHWSFYKSKNYSLEMTKV